MLNQAEERCDALAAEVAEQDQQLGAALQKNVDLCGAWQGDAAVWAGLWVGGVTARCAVSRSHHAGSSQRQRWVHQRDDWCSLTSANLPLLCSIAGEKRALLEKAAAAEQRAISLEGKQGCGLYARWHAVCLHASQPAPPVWAACLWHLMRWSWLLQVFDPARLVTPINCKLCYLQARWSTCPSSLPRPKSCCARRGATLRCGLAESPSSGRPRLRCIAANLSLPTQPRPPGCATHCRPARRCACWRYRTTWRRRRRRQSARRSCRVSLAEAGYQACVPSDACISA